MIKNLFEINIEGIDTINLNKLTYNLLRMYYRCIWYLGDIFSKIIKHPLSFHKAIYFKIACKYYRKLNMLDMIYYNKYSVIYKCNSCGYIIAKGIINKCIIINCPNCGSQYSLYKDAHNTITRHCVITKNKIDENTIIDNGIRCDEKLLGKTITVKDKY